MRLTERKEGRVIERKKSKRRLVERKEGVSDGEEDNGKKVGGK